VTAESNQTDSNRIKQAQRGHTDKQNGPSLRKLFFDSSNAPYATGSKLIPKASGFEQSRLLSLQFAENCEQKIPEAAQAHPVYHQVCLFPS